MKNYLKVIVMTLSLLLFVNVSVYAETLPSNVKLEGNAKGIVFIPGDEEFLYKDNMMPGDAVDRTMAIDNKYDTSFDLYMRAERVTPKEQYDLLTKINLKITYKGQLIYEGPVSGEDGLIKNISLGSYNPGDKAELHAEAYLDGPKTGNEYKDKTAAVKWIFTAQSKGAVAPTPTVTKVNTSNVTVQPHTGDSSIIPYVIVLAGASMILIVVAIKKRKSKEV